MENSKKTIKRAETSCTWRDASECAGCPNKERLNCRWKASHLLLFNAVVSPLMLGVLAAAVIIAIVQSAWWLPAAYILFFPLFLGIAETRFLCCHCPYYAQQGRVLHCLANHGLPKLWRYRPEPLNPTEKRLMLLRALFSC